MTQLHDIRLQVLAALAALSVSSLAILGTVGPIDATASATATDAPAGVSDRQAA